MSGTIAPPATTTITGADGYSDGLTGSGGADHMFGLSGNDALDGSGGDDILDDWAPPAGAGAVWTSGRLWGIYADNRGSETIEGGGSLAQDSAGDFVFAGGDDDKVVGGLGDDYIDGGQGNDSLTGHGGNDVIDGGDDRSISTPPEKYIPCQSMRCGAPTTKVVSTAGASSCTLPKVRRKAGMTRRRRAKERHRVMTDGGIGASRGSARAAVWFHREST